MSRSVILARPPIYPDDDDLDPPPASILLDRRGYIDDRTNATTAEGVTSSGKRIRVTFWTVNPPRCSWFTVYSPDLDNTAFGDVPMLVSTEDDLALLRVPICPLSEDGGLARNNDNFVYHAGNENKPPSLDLIPRPAPRPFFFDDIHTGLLSCRRAGDDMYFIALLLCWASLEGKYKLHLYNSKTQTWSCKFMYLAASSEQKLRYSYSSKVISIGGELGSVGWVDLWRGILICDVLKDDSTELRYIPLPPPLMPVQLRGPPLGVRDIIAVEGYIKYFEMFVHLAPQNCWKAATWVRKDSWSEWEKDCVIQVSKHPAQWYPADPLEAETKDLPTLKRCLSGYPAQSHHDGGGVYIMGVRCDIPANFAPKIWALNTAMDRQKLGDTNATLLAIDMKKQTLEGVFDYSSPRPLGYYSVYFGSGISKHLRSTRGNAATETSKHETLQFGNQKGPRKIVQSRMTSKNVKRKGKTLPL